MVDGMGQKLVNQSISMDTIKKIQTELQMGSIPPHQCAEYRAILSGYYSFYAGRLEEILLRKPAVWQQLRKDQKSDKATDNVYAATQDGMNEMGLRLRLKSLEKMMGGLKALQDLAEGESRNHY